MGVWKLKTGKYLADFRDEDRHRRYKSFTTKKAADAWAGDMKREVRRNEYVAPERMPKFREIAEAWLTSKADRRPGTIGNWRAALNQHLLPRLGELLLNQIDVAAIETLRDELRGRGLSPRTVGATMTTCAAIFKLSLRRGLVTINPAALAERPFVGSKELKGNDADDDRG